MHVDIVIPIHNEANALNQKVVRLHEYLRAGFGHRWQIVLVDHGSTDGSFWIARKLEEKFPGIAAIQVALAGRGRALKRACQSLGDVFCFLDPSQLPEDLGDIAKVVAPVAEDACDIAVGTQGSAGFASGLYRLGLRLLADLPVEDSPLKAISRRVALEVVPVIRDEGSFFDTELFAVAQSHGFRLLPVATSSKGSPLDEPLPDAMRRVLDLRKRLRGESKVGSKE